MPYSVKKLPGGRYATIVSATRKVVGRHPSRDKAIKQIQAIYANEEREGKKP